MITLCRMSFLMFGSVTIPLTGGFFKRSHSSTPVNDSETTDPAGKISHVFLCRRKLFELVQIKDGSIRHFARDCEIVRHPAGTRRVKRKAPDTDQEQGGGQCARHHGKPPY